MKKTLSITLSAFLFSLVTVISGCTQEDLSLETENNTENNYEVDNLYQYLMDQPTISILSVALNPSKSSSSHYIPEFTKGDLKYLTSLTQEEFILEQAKIMSQIENITQENIDEIAIDNYNSLLSGLGGQEEIYKLLDFGTSYLQTDGGIEDIKTTLPDGLNETEIKYYVAMCVFIDRLARPLSSIMVNNINLNPMSRQVGDCKGDAERELLLRGCEFGLDTLIEIMTGGADTVEYAFEDAYLLADLEQIYYDYEVCMGRWH